MSAHRKNLRPARHTPRFWHRTASADPAVPVIAWRKTQPPYDPFCPHPAPGSENIPPHPDTAGSHGSVPPDPSG